MCTVNRYIDILCFASCPEVPPPQQRTHPPVFMQPLQDCYVDEGDNITLGAVLSGSRPVKVTWLHNGEDWHKAMAAKKKTPKLDRRDKK